MNTTEQILQATEISESIKLCDDLEKSLKIIGKYPPLVQYIKLGNIFFNWFDWIYKETKDE